MRQLRSMLWVSAGQVLAASLAITGCATTSAGPTVAAEGAGSPDQASEEVREHHRHHHHGGVTAFIALSIDSLGLPEDRKAQVEKIQADLAARLAPARAAEQALLATLADGVAAGAIDTAKVDAQLTQLGAAAAGVHVASVDALNQLHAALSPAERQALVDKVRAHWAVWRNVNHEEKPGSHGHGSRLDRVTAELGLTPDQVSRIEQGLSGWTPPDQAETNAVQSYVDAFSQAFVGDNFDAASLHTAEAANVHIAKFGAARTARFYEVVTPVLTPEQRARLADHLREHLTPQAS